MRLSLIFKKKQIFSIPFFAKQCTLFPLAVFLPSELTYLTEERIHAIFFSESDVMKIIKALNLNKTHSRDNVSVRMTKLCANSASHLLTLIFQNFLAAGTFATR